MIDQSPNVGIYHKLNNIFGHSNNMSQIERPDLSVSVIKRKDGIYTALCPRMESVHFSSESKEEAIKMAKAGIDTYLKLNPNFLDNVQSAESVKV